MMGTCSRELSNVMVVAAEGTAAVSASFHGPQEETLENRQFSLRNYEGAGGAGGGECIVLVGPKYLARAPAACYPGIR